MNHSPGMGLTAAGTVLDFHKIPYLLESKFIEN